MPPVSPTTRLSTETDDRPNRLQVAEEGLVLRNYDDESREVAVRFVDAHDSVAIETTYRLDPRAVVSTRTRLPRAVYRVEARVDDGWVGRDCLVGSGPDETALVEVGNGLVNVAEGVF